MPQKAAEEVLKRFRDEQAYIQRYVDFLEGVTLVSTVYVRRIAGILSRYGIAEVEERTDVSRWAEPYAGAELAALVESARLALPALTTCIDEKAAALLTLPIPRDLNKG